MTMIILVNQIDADHLAAVKAEMENLGSPTIRAIDAGEYLIAIEGSHRIRAAEELGLPVNVEIVDEDGEIDFASLDYDSNNWFDETVVSAHDFIEWFTKSPFPSNQPTAEIEVA